MAEGIEWKRNNARLGQKLIGIAPKSNKEPTSLSEFHCFGKLPTELRLMIWEFALPTGGNGMRMIPIKLNPGHQFKVTIQNKYSGMRRDKQKIPQYWKESQPWLPDQDLDHYSGYGFRVMQNARSISELCCDILDIGVSAATSESRSVYLKAFTEKKFVEKGIIRHGPDTVFYIDGLFRDYWQNYHLQHTRQQFVEALQFFGEVKFAACSVAEAYRSIQPRFAFDYGDLVSKALNLFGIRDFGVLGNQFGRSRGQRIYLPGALERFLEEVQGYSVQCKKSKKETADHEPNQSVLSDSHILIDLKPIECVCKQCMQFLLPNRNVEQYGRIS